MNAKKSGLNVVSMATNTKLSRRPKKRTRKSYQILPKPMATFNDILQYGRLEIDNNRSERAIKPFVIGWKNWLFSQSKKGATASAITYSIVETAKENQLNPLIYLTYVFEQLPLIDLTDSEALDKLLPWSKTLPTDCHVPNKTK